MNALRRIAGIVVLLSVTTFGLAGCGTGAATDKPAADVAHDHDGDGVPDHAPEEHDSATPGA